MIMNELFSIQQSINNIYCCCVMRLGCTDVFFAIDDESSLVYSRSDETAGTVAVKKFKVKDYFPSTKLRPTSIHHIEHVSNHFLYIAALVGEESERRFCMVAFVVDAATIYPNIAIIPTQSKFMLSFMPLDAVKVSAPDGTPFLLMTGSDQSLHTYEIGSNGELHRSPLRGRICKHWDTRLHSSEAKSLGIRLLVEEWEGGSQGLLGYASGLLTWDRFPDSLPDSHDRGEKHDLSYPSLRSNSGDWLDQVDSLPRSPPKYLSPIPRSQKQQPADTRHVANAGPDTQHTTSRGGIAVFGLQMTPPPPPKSRGRALLLGGAITSMQFYSPSRHQQIRSLTSTTTAPDLGVSTEIEPNVEPFAPNGRVGGSPTVASKYVAIGTTEGVAAVLKLDPPPATVASPPPSPVTGRKSSWADLVRGISIEESAPVGNESDATSGHVVLPGALMHGAVQALEIADIAKNGYDDIIVGYHDGSVVLALRLVDDEALPEVSVLASPHLRFIAGWCIQLPLPILGLVFGPLLGSGINSGTSRTQHHDDQLLIQTTQSLHIFAPQQRQPEEGVIKSKDEDIGSMAAATAQSTIAAHSSDGGEFCAGATSLRSSSEQGSFSASASVTAVPLAFAAGPSYMPQAQPALSESQQRRRQQQQQPPEEIADYLDARTTPGPDSLCVAAVAAAAWGGDGGGPAAGPIAVIAEAVVIPDTVALDGEGGILESELLEVVASASSQQHGRTRFWRYEVP